MSRGRDGLGPKYPVTSQNDFSQMSVMSVTLLSIYLLSLEQIYYFSFSFLFIIILYYWIVVIRSVKKNQISEILQSKCENVVSVTVVGSVTNIPTSL